MRGDVHVLAAAFSGPHVQSQCSLFKNMGKVMFLYVNLIIGSVIYVLCVVTLLYWDRLII